MKRNTTGYVRAGIGVALLAALGWLGACSDGLGPCCNAPQALIVSDPGSPTRVAAGAAAAPSLTSSVGDEVTYVSLPPGTVPNGSTAIIRRVGDAGSIINAVRDGGFDPVEVGAQAGDSIEVVIQDPGGATTAVLGLVVLARRPPIIVRTDPPRKKTDVPLNAAIVVVFSEPLAPSSLTGASIQLFRGTTAIPGTIRVLQGTGAAAAFVPSSPLDANTSYHLEVTRGVQDVDGDALNAAASVAFTTGQSLTGPAASITLSPAPIVPDVIEGLAVHMFGATYQLTATVRDAAGNQLIDQPVTWSIAPFGGSDPQGLVVSANGLLTAFAVGVYDVTASVNEVATTLRFVVVGGPPASVEIAPTAATVGAAGDTIKLIAKVRDALGRLFPNPSVTWASSAPLLATVAADSTGGWQAFATVTGVSPGSVTITATSGAARGTASVTITAPPPVATVTISPASATLFVQLTRQLSVTIQDVNGKVLAGRTISWTTDNAAVASVDANGLVTGVSEGSAAIMATTGGVSDTAAITVTARGTGAGGQIAFHKYDSPHNSHEIYLVIADGSGEVNLTNNPAEDELLAWSPDGTQLAFRSNRDGNAEIYVMNADGSGVRNLSNSPASDGGNALVPVGSWSPDGTKIASVSDRDGNNEIYVMNVDGSGATRLTNNPAYDWEPAWSPDGTTIAFRSNRDGNHGIYVMNADGSGVRNLTNNPGGGYGPRWSPDGTKIAFGSTRDGNPEVYVMNADGSGATRLTNNPANDGAPAWSPDGTQILLLSWRDPGEIYVINPDGSGLRNLTNNPANDGPPASWSPDGAMIAFSSGREAGNGIYVMNADGSGVRFLIVGTDAAWRPQQGSLAQALRQRTRSW